MNMQTFTKPFRTMRMTVRLHPAMEPPLPVLSPPFLHLHLHLSLRSLSLARALSLSHLLLLSEPKFCVHFPGCNGCKGCCGFRNCLALGMVHSFLAIPFLLLYFLRLTFLLADTHLTLCFGGGRCLRRAGTGPRPWCHLTTPDKIAIKNELNDFKANEMAVHAESRKHTRFHK